MDDTYQRGPLLLLSGRANRPLAEEIGDLIGKSPDSATIRDFADGEIFARIDRNARGRDVFIVQPTASPGDRILELLLLIDAAKRASAARVTAVIPYYGYGRQDRKDQPRVAIGAKLMANLIVAAGADRVVGIDFHQHQIQGFFDIPVDHLYAAPVLVRYFRDKGLEDLVVVAPDVGSAKMARGYARRLKAGFAIIDKRRPAPNVAEVVNVVGDVDGKTCLLVDDMVDTGGTLVNAVQAPCWTEGRSPSMRRLPTPCFRGRRWSDFPRPPGGVGGHQYHRCTGGEAVRETEDPLGGGSSGQRHPVYSLE